MSSRKRRLVADDDDEDTGHESRPMDTDAMQATEVDAAKSEGVTSVDTFVPRSELKQIAKRFQKKSTVDSDSSSSSEDEGEAEDEQEHAQNLGKDSLGTADMAARDTDADSDALVSSQTSENRSRPRSGAVPSVFKSFFKTSAAAATKNDKVTSVEEPKPVNGNSKASPSVSSPKTSPASPVRTSPKLSPINSPSKKSDAESKDVEESRTAAATTEAYAGAHMSAPPPEVASKSAHTTSSIFGSFADHLFSSSPQSASKSSTSKGKSQASKSAPFKPLKSNNGSKASPTSPLTSPTALAKIDESNEKDIQDKSDSTMTASGSSSSSSSSSSSGVSSEISTQEETKEFKAPTESQEAKIPGEPLPSVQRSNSSVSNELFEDLKKMSAQVDEFNDFDEEDVEQSESEDELDSNANETSEQKRDVEDDEDEDEAARIAAKKRKRLIQPTIIPRPASAAVEDEVDDGNPLGTPGYDPVVHAGWKKGQKVPYAAIATMFAKCEATTKRLKIIAYVSDFLRSVIALSPEALLPAVYLCVNEVAPSYEGKELGIGDQILFKALSEATGSTLAAIKAQYRDTGDLGVLAERARAKQRTLVVPQKLTVPGVFAKLREIAELKGSKSGDRKKDFIKQLLVSSVGHEARFLCRALQGNLRIQLGLLSVLRALARAIILTPPNYPPLTPEEQRRFAEEDQIEDDEEDEDDEDKAKKAALNARPRTKLEIMIDKAHAQIEAAFNEGPSLDRLVDALLKVPLDRLHTKVFLAPGQPIKVMLGKPATGLAEVIAKFEGSPFTLEYKYDGERAQIHRLPDGSFKIYSRNLEDNTTKYPDIISKLPRALAKTTESFILDAEVVAWDPVSKKILPFQTLSTRKRKDVGEETVTVQVVLFGFDLLYLNGKSYMRRTFLERRAKMRDAFIETEGVFQYSKGLDTSELEDIDTFFQQAVEDSCEGLMVKPLVKNARYVPDKRKWIKIKKDYLDGVGDTLDLVPLGAWYGKGKRTGTYGAFLLFSYDDSEQAYQVISKIGTGFKDTDLETLTESLKQHVIDGPKSYYQYSTQKTLIPDVWFEPAQVWEVKCADLSISPVYVAAAGHVHESKGIAMRFPRFLRLRPDKKPEDATNAHQVADMYMNQSVVRSAGAAQGGPPRR